MEPLTAAVEALSVQKNDALDRAAAYLCESDKLGLQIDNLNAAIFTIQQIKNILHTGFVSTITASLPTTFRDVPFKEVSLNHHNGRITAITYRSQDYSKPYYCIYLSETLPGKVIFTLYNPKGPAWGFNSVEPTPEELDLFAPFTPFLSPFFA